MEQRMKKCRLCKEFLPATADHFYRYKGSKDGLDNKCKPCDNKRVQVRQNKKIVAHKQGPCVDCGGKYKPHQLSLDHLPGAVKFRDVSNLGSWSSHRIAQEVAKCDLVCLNCHADRTWLRAKDARKLNTTEQAPTDSDEKSE